MVLTCKVSLKPHELHAAVGALSAIHAFIMFCYNFLEQSELSKKVVFRASQKSSVVFVTGKDGFLRYHSFFSPGNRCYLWHKWTPANMSLILVIRAACLSSCLPDTRGFLDCLSDGFPSQLPAFFGQCEGGRRCLESSP